MLDVLTTYNIHITWIYLFGETTNRGAGGTVFLLSSKKTCGIQEKDVPLSVKSKPTTGDGTLSKPKDFKKSSISSAVFSG